MADPEGASLVPIGYLITLGLRALLERNEGTMMNTNETLSRVGPVMRTRALETEYGRGAGLVRALDGVELDVASGETLAVMGPSGCGKSTLLHLLGGLERPSAGEMWLDGSRIDQLSEEAPARLRRQAKVKAAAGEDDVALALVADAELFRLEAIVRWPDAADVRLKQRPHLTPAAVAEMPLKPTHEMEVPQ